MCDKNCECMNEIKRELSIIKQAQNDFTETMIDLIKVLEKVVAGSDYLSMEEDEPTIDISEMTVEELLHQLDFDDAEPIGVKVMKIKGQ